MMVKALEVGQVSFLSDGQIGYSSISTQTLVDAIRPCDLASEIANGAAAQSLTVAVENQHLNSFKFHALSVAGSTILHFIGRSKDHKWKQAGTLLDDFKETQALLRSSGGIDVTRDELPSADTLGADAKVYIADTLVISAAKWRLRLDLMEQAIKIGEASQKHCLTLGQPVQNKSVVFQVELTWSGVDCSSLERATLVAKAIVSSSEAPLSWLSSLWLLQML